jgi:DegV family protein with EDD domain
MPSTPDIAIVTDSVACLPHELAEKYHIRVIPAATILFKGKTYRDWLDISPSEAYQMLEEAPEHFSTSAISPTEIFSVFQNVSHRARVILCITLSQKFSGLYNAAVVAAQLLKERMPETKIEVFDSRTATAAQGFIALAAARAAEEGKDPAEVISTAERIRDRVGLFYIFETIRYVYRTGRIPKMAAEFTSKLDVKPIITIRDSSAHVCGITRNKGHGIDKLLESARQEVDDQPVHMAVLHTDAPDEAEALKQRVSTDFDCVELWTSQFSPVMGYATGRGVVGIAFYHEDYT